MKLLEALGSWRALLSSPHAGQGWRHLPERPELLPCPTLTISSSPPSLLWYFHLTGMARQSLTCARILVWSWWFSAHCFCLHPFSGFPDQIAMCYSFQSFPSLALPPLLGTASLLAVKVRRARCKSHPPRTACQTSLQKGGSSTSVVNHSQRS